MGISVPKKEGFFSSKQDAKEYYRSILSKLNQNEPLINEETENVLDLHRRYCVATNWPESNGVEVTRNLNNAQRKEGNYSSSYQLAVVDLNGQITGFSITKAINAIATKQ